MFLIIWTFSSDKQLTLFFSQITTENKHSFIMFSMSEKVKWKGFLVYDFIVFYATINNISVISWRSVLLEETGGPGENHRPVASHWQTLSYNVVHLVLIGIWTHHVSGDGTDCIGSCKSNYHTITATTNPRNKKEINLKIVTIRY